MGIKNIILVLLTLSASLCCLTCCNDKNETSNFENEVTGYGGIYVPETDYLNRPSWNITLEYLKTDETGIWIKIRDNDNIGFYYNPLYFILERYENNEWRKISLLTDLAKDQYRAYVFPDEKEKYADTNCICRFIAIDESKFTSGKYRITKIISEKKFYIEFEINE